MDAFNSREERDKAKAELQARLREIEKEERAEARAKAKEEQRKKNEFCKKNFNKTYKEIETLILQEGKSRLSKEEQEAIEIWGNILSRYNPRDKKDLVAHLLSDIQVNYYNAHH